MSTTIPTCDALLLELSWSGDAFATTLAFTKAGYLRVGGFVGVNTNWASGRAEISNGKIVKIITDGGGAVSSDPSKLGFKVYGIKLA